DRIAYLTHDVADALRAGVISFVELPERAVRRFGDSSRQWIDSMITAVIEASVAECRVLMDEPTLEVMHELRDFMFQKVYPSPEAEGQKQRAITVIRNLTDYYAAHPAEIPDSYRVDDTDDLTRAIDYVSGMTDRFALSTHDTLFRPRLF